MEERRKLGVGGRILLTLLILLLLILCFLAGGFADLTLGVGPRGVYTTDETAEYLSSVYLETDTDDLLITARNRRPADGELVTYIKGENVRAVDLYDDLLGHAVLDTAGEAKPEPVLYILHGGGRVLKALYGVRWFLWGGTAGLLAVLIVMKLTSRKRWRRRQQKKMLENFRRFGEQYDREDEDMDY